ENLLGAVAAVAPQGPAGARRSLSTTTFLCGGSELFTENRLGTRTARPHHHEPSYGGGAPPRRGSRGSKPRAGLSRTISMGFNTGTRRVPKRQRAGQRSYRGSRRVPAYDHLRWHVPGLPPAL